MTKPIKLLVSVRNQSESAAAIEAAVDVIDWKEPREGPLAPVDPQLWRDAADQLDLDQAPLVMSAALGEPEQAADIASAVPSRFAFAKVGPRGCDTPAKLTRCWQQVRQQLDAAVELVAVAYADSHHAQCLTAEEVFQLAGETGFSRCLIDTFGKNGKSTLDWLGMPGLAQIAQTARCQGLWWALAGSIKLQHLGRLRSNHIRPDCIGLRGDVCRQDRTSNLDAQRVKTWQHALQDLATRPVGPDNAFGRT